MHPIAQPVFTRVIQKLNALLPDKDAATEEIIEAFWAEHDRAATEIEVAYIAEYVRKYFVRIAACNAPPLREEPPKEDFVFAPIANKVRNMLRNKEIARIKVSSTMRQLFIDTYGAVPTALDRFKLDTAWTIITIRYCDDDEQTPGPGRRGEFQ